MTNGDGVADNQCRVFAPPVRLVLFDLDDTLGDYASARASRLRRAFTPHLHVDAAVDIETTLEQMIAASILESPHGTEHFPRLFMRFGIGAPDAATTAAQWYRSNRFFDLRLFDDAVETLEALRYVWTPAGTSEPRGLGIVTNGPTDVQRDKIELLGIAQLVDFVLISEDFGVEKPDPRIYAEALRLGRATAAETVFVGDAPQFDILGANNAGMRSIWVNRTGEAWSDQDHRPTCEVLDLKSVVELLGSHSNLD